MQNMQRLIKIIIVEIETDFRVLSKINISFLLYRKWNIFENQIEFS